MKEAHLKTRVTQLDHYVDSDTGELLDMTVKKHKYIANSKEEFMLMYASMLPILSNLSKPSVGVYAYLLNNYAQGNKFEIGSGMRSLIAEYAGVSTSSVVKSLKELTTATLVYKHSIRGIYQINPRYAFKGSSADRSKELKVIIELGCEDC